MALWDWFKKAEHPAEETTERVVEAASATSDGIDPDGAMYTKLSGRDSTTIIAPWKNSQGQKVALYLWKTNLLANRLIELPVAYILAEGLTVTHTDETYQDVINRFWNDPITNMDWKLPKKARELSLYGEQCWPTFVNEHTGHVRLGYLSPRNIATVIKDPDNPEQPIGIVTTKDRKGLAKRYKVIVNGPDSELFTLRTQAIRKSFTDGECFYFAINNLSDEERGSSDLLAQADWLDAYDNFLFGELDRVDFLRAFIWDVEVTGADQATLDKKAREDKPPAPGSRRYHNENETWTAVSPSIAAADTEKQARLLRNHVLGGQGFPEHWFGGGGDVNRSTGESMSEPTFKTFTMRQTLLKQMLSQVIIYVLRQYELINNNAGEPELDSGVYDASINFPELTAKDTTKYATALQQVSAAVVVLLGRKLITEGKALEVVASIATQLGVEVDAQAELEAAKQAAQEESEHDLFSTTPDEPVTDNVD